MSIQSASSQPGIDPFASSTHLREVGAGQAYTTLEPPAQQVAFAPALFGAWTAVQVGAVLVGGLGLWWSAKTPHARQTALAQIGHDLGRVTGLSADAMTRMQRFVQHELPATLDHYKQQSLDSTQVAGLVAKTLIDRFGAGASTSGSLSGTTTPTHTQPNTLPNTQSSTQSTGTQQPSLYNWSPGNNAATRNTNVPTSPGSFNLPVSPSSIGTWRPGGGPAVVWQNQARSILSQAMPTAGVQAALRELGVSLDKPVARIESTEAAATQFDRVSTLRRTLGEDNWGQLTQGTGLDRELGQLQQRLVGELRSLEGDARDLMKDGASLMHRGRRLSDTESAGLSAIGQRLGGLQRQIDGVYGVLRTAGVFAGGFQHAVSGQIDAHMKQVRDFNLAQGTVSRSNLLQVTGVTEPLNASASGLGIDVDVALGTLERLGAAWQGLGGSQESALAAARGVGDELRHQLNSSPRLRAVVQAASVAQQGGPPLKPDDDKVFTALVNGLSNALASSLGEAAQVLFGAQQVDHDRVLRSVTTGLLVGLVVPDGGNNLLMNTVSNGVSNGMETWLRQMVGLDAHNPTAIGTDIAVGAGAGLILGELVRLLGGGGGGSTRQVVGEVPNKGSTGLADSPVQRGSGVPSAGDRTLNRITGAGASGRSSPTNATASGHPLDVVRGWGQDAVAQVKTVPDVQAAYQREFAAYLRSDFDPRLANRNAFEANLLPTPASERLVIGFEVPGTLKFVNDNVGHLEADKIPVAVANIVGEISQQPRYASLTSYHLGAARFGVEGPPVLARQFLSDVQARIASLDVSINAGSRNYSQTALPVVSTELTANLGTRRELFFGLTDGLDQKALDITGTVVAPIRGDPLLTLNVTPTNAPNGVTLVDPSASPPTQGSSQRALDLLPRDLRQVIDQRAEQISTVQDGANQVQELVGRGFTTGAAMGSFLPNGLAYERFAHNHPNFASLRHGFADVGALGATNKLISRDTGDGALAVVHGTASGVAEEMYQETGQRVWVFAVGGDELRFVGDQTTVAMYADRFKQAMQDASIQGTVLQEISGDLVNIDVKPPVYVGVGRKAEIAEVNSNVEKAADPGRVANQLHRGSTVEPYQVESTR